MNGMLVHYDAAMKALSTALSSNDVTVVLKSREDLELLRVRARQIRDRELLADATEFQMRVERRLGVLLKQVKEAGELARGPRSKDGPQVTLKDIGIDKKLSASVQRSAAMTDGAFEDRVREVRATVVLGRKMRVVRGARDRSQEENSPFEHRLLDGTPIGIVRLGSIQSRIRRAAVELALLNEISAHIGGSADQLSTVQQTISVEQLDRMIEAAGKDR
jgi:hypothetical protein